MIVAVLCNAIIEALKKFSFYNIGEDQITLFIIGFGVVYVALTLIYLLINVVPKFLKLNFKKNNIVNKKDNNISVEKTKINTSNNEEVNAAIAMAISLYIDDQHDDESFVLTMKINERLSSNWSHKVLNANFYNFK